MEKVLRARKKLNFRKQLMLYTLAGYKPYDGSTDKLPELAHGGHGDYDQVRYSTWQPKNRHVIAQATGSDEILTKMIALREQKMKEKRDWIFRIEVEPDGVIVQSM